MNYDELSLKGFINEMKDASSGAHSRKFCFVIGAGASRTSGIKSGQELVDIWDKELAIRNYDEYKKWKTDLSITEQNKYNFYSHYYEKRFKKSPSDGFNFLEKLMTSAKPSVGYIMLAYLLSKTDNNIVITTNFDHLIEDAFLYQKQTIPMVIAHENLTKYALKKAKRPIVIKIHRDLLFEPANFINQVETLHDNWKTVLNNIFAEYYPIFIGYAGNDNSLMNYLIDNGEKFIKGEWNFPYWMLYNNDKIDNKVFEFLNKSKGYYIKHNGFDRVLFLLAATLNYQVPTKADFINDAEKRYIILSTAIDSFTEDIIKNKISFLSENNTIINHTLHQVINETIPHNIYLKAITLQNEGKHDEAISKYQNLVEMEPNNPLYHNRYGITLYELKHYDDAIVEIKKAIELEPNNALYHNNYGVILDDIGQHNDALIEKQIAVNLDPNNAIYHDILAVTLYKINQCDEALVEKQKASELDPNDAINFNNLSCLLLEMNRYDDALVPAQKAVELDPNNSVYRYNLGVVLNNLKRYDDALKEKQNAVELDPNNAINHNSLGIALLEMNRYDDALVEVKKAVDIEPYNASYHFNLSIILNELKRYDEALIEKLKVVELESSNHDIIDN